MPFVGGVFYSTGPPLGGSLAQKFKQFELGLTEAYATGGGTEVEANPTDPIADSLSTISIDSVTYSISGMGGGEQNVQSNWAETNSALDSFIIGKPTIPTIPVPPEIGHVLTATGKMAGNYAWVAPMGMPDGVVDDLTFTKAANTVTATLTRTLGSAITGTFDVFDGAYASLTGRPTLFESIELVSALPPLANALTHQIYGLVAVPNMSNPASSLHYLKKEESGEFRVRMDNASPTGTHTARGYAGGDFLPYYEATNASALTPNAAHDAGVEAVVYSTTIATGRSQWRVRTSPTLAAGTDATDVLWLSARPSGTQAWREVQVQWDTASSEWVSADYTADPLDTVQHGTYDVVLSTANGRVGALPVVTSNQMVKLTDEYVLGLKQGEIYTYVQEQIAIVEGMIPSATPVDIAAIIAAIGGNPQTGQVIKYNAVGPTLDWATDIAGMGGGTTFTPTASNIYPVLKTIITSTTGAGGVTFAYNDAANLITATASGMGASTFDIAGLSLPSPNELSSDDDFAIADHSDSNALRKIGADKVAVLIRPKISGDSGEASNVAASTMLLAGGGVTVAATGTAITATIPGYTDGQVQTLGDARYVAKAGDTMTGTLIVPNLTATGNITGGPIIASASGGLVQGGTLNIDPEASTRDARLTQTQANLGITPGGISQATADTLYVQVAGDTMTGDLKFRDSTQTRDSIEIQGDAGGTNLKPGFRFGAGSSTPDTTLFRDGINEMKTGGKFTAVEYGHTGNAAALLRTQTALGVRVAGRSASSATAIQADLYASMRLLVVGSAVTPDSTTNTLTINTPPVPASALDQLTEAMNGVGTSLALANPTAGDSTQQDWLLMYDRSMTGLRRTGIGDIGAITTEIWATPGSVDAMSNILRIPTSRLGLNGAATRVLGWTADGGEWVAQTGMGGGTVVVGNPPGGPFNNALNTLSIAGVGFDIAGMGGGTAVVANPGGAPTDNLNTISIGGNDFAISTAPTPEIAGFSGSRVKFTANQLNQNFTAHTSLSWNSEKFDVGGWWGALNPTRLTVPAGVHYVVLSGGVDLQDISTGADICFDFTKNGVGLGIGYSVKNAAAAGEEWKATADTGIIAVTPGDYFEMSLEVMSDPDFTIDENGTYFSIHAVGAPAVGAAVEEELFDNTLPTDTAMSCDLGSRGWASANRIDMNLGRDLVEADDDKFLIIQGSYTASGSYTRRIALAFTARQFRLLDENTRTGGTTGQDSIVYYVQRNNIANISTFGEMGLHFTRRTSGGADVLSVGFATNGTTDIANWRMSVTLLPWTGAAGPKGDKGDRGDSIMVNQTPVSAADPVLNTVTIGGTNYRLFGDGIIAAETGDTTLGPNRQILYFQANRFDVGAAGANSYTVELHPSIVPVIGNANSPTTSGNLTQITIGAVSYDIPGASSGLSQAEVDARINFLVPSADNAAILSVQSSNADWDDRHSWTAQNIQTTVQASLASTSGILRNYGIPAGGTDGQYIAKDGTGDRTTEWRDVPAGGTDTNFYVSGGSFTLNAANSLSLQLTGAGGFTTVDIPGVDLSGLMGMGGTVVAANPGGTDGDDLTRLTIGGTNYNIAGGSGTTVVGNPTASSTDTLSTVQIGGTVYAVGGGDISTVEQFAIQGTSARAGKSRMPTDTVYTGDVPGYISTWARAANPSGTADPDRLGSGRISTLTFRFLRDDGTWAIPNYPTVVDPATWARLNNPTGRPDPDRLGTSGATAFVLGYGDGTTAEWVAQGTGGTTPRTDEEIRDVAAAQLREGLGISIFKDDPGNRVTIAADTRSDTATTLVLFTHNGVAYSANRDYPEESFTFGTLDEVTTLATIRGAVVVGGQVYILGVRIGQNGHLLRSNPSNILDVTDLGRFTMLDGDIEGMASDGTTTYLLTVESNGRAHTYEADMATPNNATEVGNVIWNLASSRSFVYHNGTYYVFTGTQLYSLNVTNPTGTLVGGIPVSSGESIHAGISIGGKLYALTSGLGFRRLWLINPTTPNASTVIGDIPGIAVSTQAGVGVDLPLTTRIVPEQGNLYYTDARVNARILPEARTGNTDRWAKTKLPTDIVYGTGGTQEVFSVATPGARPTPTVDTVDKLYYVKSDNSLSIGIDDKHTTSVGTATFTNIPARTDFHIANAQPTDLSIYAVNDYIFANYSVAHGGQEFYKVITNGVNRNLMQVSAATALNGSRSVNTYTAEFLGAEATATEALRFLFAEAADTNYFWYDTTASQMKIMTVGTFTAPGGQLDHYLFARIGFSGDYNDLTNRPTLGSAAALDTGTTSGDIPVLGSGGDLADSLLTSNIPRKNTTNTFTNTIRVEPPGNSVCLFLDATNLTTQTPFVFNVNPSGNQQAMWLRRGDSGQAWMTVDGNAGGTNEQPGIFFGPGGNATRDVVLHRRAADVLKTPDAMDVNSLQIAGTEVIDSSGILSLGSVPFEVANLGLHLEHLDALTSDLLIDTEKNWTQSNSDTVASVSENTTEFSDVADVTGLTYTHFITGPTSLTSVQYRWYYVRVPTTIDVGGVTHDTRFSDYRLRHHTQTAGLQGGPYEDLLWHGDIEEIGTSGTWRYGKIRSHQYENYNLRIDADLDRITGTEFHGSIPDAGQVKGGRFDVERVAWTGSQTDYDALTPDASTLYLVTS